MQADDEKKPLPLSPQEEDNQDTGGESGGTAGTGGGSSGEIHFRYQDILSTGLRDDLLTGRELKRVLAVHNDIHKARVDNQKQIRKERKILKEGRTNLASSKETMIAQRARGNSMGRTSPYKKHPISEKAQFSGIDKQVSALPSENMAETNKEQQNELQNRNELQLRHSNKYTPKPRPY